MSDWRFQCKKVYERGGNILASGQWSDCKFLVGCEEEKTSFNAHKLFLSMASPVFDCMLNGPMAEDVIEIPDVRPKAFKSLLEYIYTDNINISSFDQACDLYYCANKYMLPCLVEGCVHYLQDNVNCETVCQIFEFCRMFDEISLLNECVEVILLKTKELLTHPNFMNIKLNIFKEILKFNVLNIDSELDLYYAVFNYSKAYKKDSGNSIQDNEINSTTSSKNDDFTKLEKQSTNVDAIIAKRDESLQSLTDEDKSKEEPKEIFRTLIEEVRLLTLTPQEFAENVADSPFITKSESYALLMNIASRKTSIPVPTGFNTSYKQRYKLETNQDSNLDLGLSLQKDRAETTYRFLVKNFSENMTMSLPFYVQGLSWSIAVNPHATNPDQDEQRHLGIFLYCCWVNKSSQWSCPVKAEINLVSNKSNAIHLVRTIEHVFTSKENNRGSQIPFETILDPTYGYLKNDILTVEVHVVAEEPIKAFLPKQL